MTNELKSSLKEITDEITSSKDYQDYLNLSKKMAENEEITNLIKDIKKIQKELVKREYYKEDKKSIEEEYNIKVNKLNSYPLYQAFLEKQTKINDKIQYVKDEIQGFFDEI